MKPILVNVRQLSDKAFEPILKARGKNVDKEIENLAAFLAVVEATGGKAGVSATEKQIAKRYEDLYWNILLESMVRRGYLEAKYTAKGRIKTVKSTLNGRRLAERVIARARAGSHS